MARIRTIKPEFFQSQSVGRLSLGARLLFIGLWTQADDEGRARGAPSLLSGVLFPYDKMSDDGVSVCLAELENERMIVRYQVDGCDYIQVSGWHDHQRINRPSPSKIPPPREASLNVHGGLTEDSLRDRDQGSGSGKGRDQGSRTYAPAREASRNGKPTAGLAADAWRSRWEERHENDILRASPLDWSTLAADADKIGMAELEARIDRYLAADREWLIEHKHPLRSFLKDIAEYGVPLAELAASALIPEVWCKRCGLDPAVDVRGSGCDRCRYLPDTEARKLYDERPSFQ